MAKTDIGKILESSNDKISVELRGDLIKNQLKEINFSYKEINSFNNNCIEIEPWKIKTLKF